MAKILQVTTVDSTVKAFLLPLIDRLQAEGHEVHIACSEGNNTPYLKRKGYMVNSISMERRISIFSNIKSLWELYQLIKKNRYDIVHVHTAIASVLGRIAAWLNQVPIIIYTAHGFYFHEHMSSWKRRLFIWLEKGLCSITHLVFTVSQEDEVTAIKEKICRKNQVIWTGNGVDTIKYFKAKDTNGMRRNLGLSSEDKVICFIGRLVAEKGILELIEAMAIVKGEIPNAKLLLVGETLDSDRDKKTKGIIKDIIANSELAQHIIMTGFREDIPEILDVIDLFVLPSYREGLPVSVIEAMASGKPIVATNIRGCREEVVPGKNGFLVPVGDPGALSKAILDILSNPMRAKEMGDHSKLRVKELFDECTVLEREIRAYNDIISTRLLNKN